MCSFWYFKMLHSRLVVKGGKKIYLQSVQLQNLKKFNMTYSRNLRTAPYDHFQTRNQHTMEFLEIWLKQKC